MASLALERHYRVKELAALWGLSPKTVMRVFAGEADIIRIDNKGKGKRRYATLSIPESVALRVHERLGCHPSFQTAPETDNEPRIIRFSDLHARKPKGTRDIIKLKTLSGGNR